MTGWKDKRRVMQRYDLTADMYEERYREEQQAKYGAALENVSLAGKQVLDVGMRLRFVLRLCIGLPSMVVGVDISRKLLLKANEEAKKSGNVFVLLADADHLPFYKGLF